MKKLQKVIEFCEQSWNFTDLGPDTSTLVPEFSQNYAFFSDIKIKHRFGKSIFSDHFCKISLMQTEQKDSHEEYNDGQGKVMENCFAKSVGTLLCYLVSSVLTPSSISSIFILSTSCSNSISLALSLSCKLKVRLRWFGTGLVKLEYLCHSSRDVNLLYIK